jgi:ligand-binding sensor domain-containing protein
MTNHLITILMGLLMGFQTFAQQELTLPSCRQYTMRDGLSQMQVTCMMQDSRGMIWIGTKGGLNLYNGQKFSPVISKQLNFTSGEFIQDIAEDTYGRIWVSTLNGVAMINGEIEFYNTDPLLTGSKLTADNEGRIWFVSSNRFVQENHIGYFNGNQKVVLPQVLPSGEYFSWVDIIWNTIENTAILALDTFLYSYRYNNRAEIIPSSYYFNHFIPGMDGRVYFSDFTDKYNFSVYEVVNKEIREVVRVRDGNYSEGMKINDTLFLISNSVPVTGVKITPDEILYDFYHGISLNRILNDRDNHLWIGSEDGLYQIFDNGFVAYNKTTLPQIWATIEGNNGEMWFSSYLYGLFQLKNNKLYEYPNDFENKIANPYFHPSVDKSGRIFFPNSYGILVVDREEFHQYRDPHFITTFYDREQNLLWGGGLMRAVVFDEQMKVVRVVDKQQGLNVGTNVLTILKDTAGLYWFGGGGGVARYDWSKDSLKNYKLSGLANGAMTSCVDHKGRVWFGSKQGLFWFDAMADSLVKVEREELTEAVNMVTPIDSTWLLVSQPYGIYLMDLKKYYRNGEVVLHLFNEKNGFVGIEPGQDGAYTDSKGNIWMTTSTELMKLDPQKLQIGKHSFEIRLSKLNGKPLPYTVKSIEIERNQNSAVITFDAICFIRPNPVEYSWRIGSSGWSAWQYEDYSVLSGLSDGHTTLSVRARVKGLPIDAPVEIFLPLLVRIAIYRQPWFWFTMFAIISLIGSLLMVASWLRMKKASREATVFQVQAIQSQMNPHFIFNVLASLQSKILNNNIQQANLYLVRMAELIRGFLDASANTGMIVKADNQSGQITLAQELKMIEEFVELQQMIFPGKFDYQVNIYGIDSEREFVPPMLMQPFVENSIRHGLIPLEAKGLLKIEIGKTDKGLHVEISDNGIGVRKAKDLQAVSGFRYISRGRELTMRRIELLNKLGFKISFNSESNENGTVVNIIILR